MQEEIFTRLHETPAFNSRFDENLIDNQIFLNNLIPIQYMVALSAIINLFTIMLHYVCKKFYRFKWCRVFGMYLEKQISFTYPVTRMFVDDYLGILFPAVINTLYIIRNTDDLSFLYASDQDVFNTIAVIATLILCITFPIYAFYKMKEERRDGKLPDGALNAFHEEFSRKKWWSIHYQFIIMTRMIFQILLVLLLAD